MPSSIGLLPSLRANRSRRSQVFELRFATGSGRPSAPKSTQPAFGVISTRRVQKPGQLTRDVAVRDGRGDDGEPVLVLAQAQALPAPEEGDEEDGDGEPAHSLSIGAVRVRP